MSVQEAYTTRYWVDRSTIHVKHVHVPGKSHVWTLRIGSLATVQFNFTVRWRSRG